MTHLHIPRAYVGRVNVVGDCYVFGAALHGVAPVYLDVAGPATSVEAVWAKLSQGKEARIVPDTGLSIVLQPPKPGLFARFQRKIEGLGIDHLLLVHKAIAEPHYAELTTTYILHTNTERTAAILGQHVTRLVKVAVFPAWHTYLLAQGRAERLVQPCIGYGGVQAESVTLDADAWTRLIQTGLAAGDLQLP